MQIPHPRQIFGVLFAAMICVVFSISFAAIIYSGDLEPFLSRGIGLALLGSLVLGVVGAFVLSYRGAVVQAQDAPAILMSGGVAAIVSQGQLQGEELFATVAALVFVTSLVVGLFCLVVGYLKLGILARYIPYPVLAGFLAATGVLLCKGGMELALGTEINPSTLPALFSPDPMAKWLPVLGAALCIIFATRVFSSKMTLPVALIATTFGFLALIRAMGLSADEAQTQGFLLGPFPDGALLAEVSPMVLFQANWTAVLSQTPVILSVVAICLIGMALNASGLELELGIDVELNKEVRGIGLANSLGAWVGGMPSYHQIGQTLLAHKLGLIGPVAGISGAIGGALVLLFGATTLSLLPIGLFATVITYLGLDLILTWFWGNRRKLRIYDYAIVAIIPITAITFGFLTAIGVGLLLAFCLFVISYARLSTIRLQSNVSARRSFVERPQDQVEILAGVGVQAHFIELTGFLFFGSANVLRDNVLMLLNDKDTALKWLIVDFKHVVGMDVSTTQMLRRVQSDCSQRDVRLVLSGVTAEAVDMVQPLLEAPQTLQFLSFDEALEHVEDQLLAEYSGAGGGASVGILEQIVNLQTQKEMERHAKTLTLQAGETLIASGTKSTEIYFLVSGQLLVSVKRLGGAPKIVAKIRPGAIVGEMNYYAQGERSADVIAEDDVEVVCIDVQSLEAQQEDGSEIAAVFHKAMALHLSQRLYRTTTLLRNLDT